MFNALSGSRPIGFGGVGSVPFSEIVTYIEKFGTYVGFEEDIQIFQAMDRVFLEQSRKEAEKVSERAKQKQQAARKR